MDVGGKVIVITGAARGIGQEYVRALTSLQARVVAADIADCSDTLALVQQKLGTTSVWAGRFVAIAALGTALFYCDALITPAISVLSAVEGVSVATSYYSDNANEHNTMTDRRSHRMTRDNIANAIGLGIRLRVGIVVGSDSQRVTQARPVSRSKNSSVAESMRIATRRPRRISAASTW